jgi:two-component system sensor kinase FixL
MKHDPTLHSLSENKVHDVDHALLKFMLATFDDAITCVAPDGTLLAWSKGAEIMFGYSADEMLGKNVNDVFPMFATPEIIAQEQKRLARAAAGEEIPPYESVRTRRDGSSIHLLLSALPIRNAQGEIIAVVRVSRDISERKAHEQDKALLAQIVTSSSDAIVSYGLDGRVTSWNPGAERIYGYSAAEMIGTTFEERIAKFTTPDNFALEKSVLDRAAAGERVAPFEAVRIRKDGSLISLLTSVSPVCDAQGRIVGVSRVVHDISERKAHEQDRALIAQMVHSSNDAIITYNLDTVITSWNPAAERIYGYSAAEMIGTSLRDRVGEFVTTPERADEEVRLTAKVAAGERIAPFEAVRVRKDGSEVVVLVAISAIRDADGRIVGVSRTVRDISERKAHEAQAALLRSIVEGSNDAIYTKTLDGTITTWNPAAEAMFGYKADEIVGRPVLALFPPDRAGEEATILDRIRAGETIRHYETTRVHRNGEQIDVAVTVSPIRDSLGAIVGVSDIVRDITERKRYEARLKSMQDDLVHVARLNELGQVSAGIAHELNQPLAALLNYSNLAKRLLATGGPAEVQKASEAVAKASEQAIRAGEIIRRMRGFVEKRQSNRKTDDVNAIVRDTMALGMMGADAVNVTTRLDLAPHLPQVTVDRVQIQQVLVNLLHNAVDAMANCPKRELTVGTALLNGDTIEIRVSDTGAGIQKEHVDHLFMPFFTTKRGGMGIGLVISRSIVEAHGGKIVVEPNRGGGTTFRFTLPATAN